ncbi:MAG TPA: NADH-quinone oxidoreductase subunit C [Candidatus Sulfotelmatobacter sp.]|nr:NADH-quinone oxidoreductase subunit C [Candidatus Sulfotelmatobacter sp.]
MDLFAGPSEADDCGTMTMLLARPDEHDWVALRDTGVAASGYPSLTRRIPAADWYERELFASRHIVPLGHPHLAPLGLDREMTADRILLDRPLEPADIGVVDYPLGPVRSGIVESGHYTLRSVGEEIVDLRLQLAYKHRGIEDLATGVAWPLLPLLAERISGTDAVANALASCIALEALGGLVPTPRAQALRLIAAELERLHDHAAFQAELCQATGLSVAQAQFEIVRERLLRLAARLVGHRYLFGFVVPGGVAVDLDPAALEDLRRTVVEARAALATLGSMVAGSGSHLDRLRGTGRVSLTQAADLALTGPVARAAGLDIDARRDLPYGAYAARGVAVASAEGGDAAARAAVRQAESLISADLIVDTVDHLPDGPAAVEPVRIDAAPLAATSAALGWAEGSRGTELHWLETDGAGRVARYRIRSASFACWQVFARSIPGSNILTDFPIIEQSFGLSFAGADR